MTDKLFGYRIVVTGVAGFLGRQFAKELIRQGADVIGIDTISPDACIFPVSDRFRFFNGELIKVLPSARDFLTSAPSNRRGIYHMAGLADAERCSTHPDIAFDSHVKLTYTLLEFCRRLNGVIFVFPSTGLVYGHSQKIPSKEDDAVHPATVYAAMKNAVEILIKTYSETFAVRAIVARLGNVYGPGVSADTVVGRILKQAMNKKPIRVREKGSVRDFIYSGDVVEAVLRLMPITETQKHLLVNIATGTGISIGDLAMEASKIFRVPEDSRASSADSAIDPSRIVLSIEKLKNLTNWTPQTPLVEGLLKSMEVKAE